MLGNTALMNNTSKKKIFKEKNNHDCHFVSKMNHSIEHEVLIDGIIYRVLKEDDFDEALNFYFDVFLKGKNQQTTLFYLRT